MASKKKNADAKTVTKGMIAYAIATLMAGIFGVWMSASIFSEFRWLALVVGFVGVISILRAWAMASAFHYALSGNDAWWSIKNIMFRRYTQS